jgi:hypothetical protein
MQGIKTNCNLYNRIQESDYYEYKIRIRNIEGGVQEIKVTPPIMDGSELQIHVGFTH